MRPWPESCSAYTTRLCDALEVWVPSHRHSSENHTSTAFAAQQEAYLTDEVISDFDARPAKAAVKGQKSIWTDKGFLQMKCNMGHTLNNMLPCSV
eukprot:7056093-Pyramimonas_sp.AAC.2